MNSDSSDEEIEWDLNKIDWKKAAADLGKNVDIVEDPNHLDAPLLIPKLQHVRNKTVLKSKLTEISETQDNLPFIERLSITTEKRVNIRNANHDIKREIQFYDATLDAVRIGLSKLDAINSNLIQRPNDYYAECVKSDHHMARVKQRILHEKKKVGVVEERKQRQRLKKYHKQIMSEKLKNEKQQSRNVLDAIEQWQQFSKNETNAGLNGQNPDNTLDEILKSAQFGKNNKILDDIVNSRNNKNNKNNKYNKKKPNMKRILKNLKYGGMATTTHMARKGKNKHRNTVMSTNMFENDWKASKFRDREENKGFLKNNKGRNKRYNGNNRNSRFNGNNRNNNNFGNQRYNSARISNAQGLNRNHNQGFNKFNKRGRTNVKMKKKYGVNGNNKRNFTKRPGKNTRLRAMLGKRNQK